MGSAAVGWLWHGVVYRLPSKLKEAMRGSDDILGIGAAKGWNMYISSITNSFLEEANENE